MVGKRWDLLELHDLVLRRSTEYLIRGGPHSDPRMSLEAVGGTR